MAPIINILKVINDNMLLIIPIFLGLCFVVYGLMMAAGDHGKAKLNIFYAFIGGAVALGAPAIAAAIKP